MQPLRPTGIITAIDAVSRRADELARVELARGDGVRVGDALLRRALTDAEAASAQLATGAWGDEPATAARLAVRILEHGVPDQVALRDLGMRLRGVVADVRQAPAVRASQAVDLIDRAPDGALSSNDWTTLRDLLDDADVVARLHAATDTDAVAAVRATVGAVVRREAAAVPSDALDPFTSVAVAAMSPNERAARATSIMSQQLKDIPAPAWRKLAELLETDPTGTAINVPRTIDHLPDLPKVARLMAQGAEEGPPKAIRYLDLFATQQLPADTRAAQLDRLLSRPNDDLRPEDMRRLQSLSIVDTADQFAGVPDLFGQSFRRWLDDGGYSGAAEGIHVRGALDVARMLRASDTSRRAAAQELLSRDFRTYGDADWSRLYALDHVDTDRSILGMPARIDHDDLSYVASYLMYGSLRDKRQLEKIAHFFEHASARALAPSARADEAHALLSRSPTELSKDEWRRLAALVDADETGLIQVERSIGGRSFGAEARRMTEEHSYLSADLRSFFDRSVVARSSNGDPSEQLRTLLARDPSTFATSDWTRFAAVLHAQAERGTIGITHEIAGLPSLQELALKSASSRHIQSQVMHYWDRLAVDQLDDAQRKSQLAGLMARPHSELDRGDWLRLATLLDTSAPGLPDVPRVPKYLELARARGIGAHINSSHLELYAHRFAVDQLDDAARDAEITDLLARAGTYEGLSSAQVYRLSTYLDLDTTNTRILAPATISNLTPLSDLLRGGGSTKGNTSQLRHYVERDVVARMTKAERTVEVDAILREGSWNVHGERARRLAALLDDGINESNVVAPRKLDGITDTFTDLLRRNADLTRGDDDALRAYFDAIQARAMPTADRQQKISDLLSSEWTNQHQARELAALVESETDPEILRRTSTIPDVRSFLESAHDYVKHDSKGPGFQRYLNRAAAMLRPEAERAEVVDQLTARDPRVLSTDDWVALRTVLDSDTDGVLVRTGVDLTTLRAQAHRMAIGGEYADLRRLGQEFDAHAFSRLGAAERSEMALTTIDAIRAARETTRNAARLLTLMRADADETIVQLPRTIAGTRSLEDVLETTVVLDHAPEDLARYVELGPVMQESATARAAEASTLFERGAGNLTRAEWARLGNLLDSDPDGILIDAQRTLDDFTDLSTIARQIGLGHRKVDEAASQYFHAWHMQHDPQFKAHIESAIERVATGRAEVADRAVVRDLWYRMAHVVEGRPPQQQAAIAAVMLGSDELSSTKAGVRQALQVARAGFADQPVPEGQLGSLHTETLELIDRNLARLDGRTPNGAVRGYSNHPDYAEVGRVRSNLALLAHAQGLADAPAAPTSAVDQASAGTAELAW